MVSAPQRIVIISHRGDRHRNLRAYAIWHLAEFWRSQGLEVIQAFGARAAPPADLAILHVDLSIVPARYVHLAEHYPIALNARITDIRKSTYSTHLLEPHTAYDGPVIVKTDQNNAGITERRYRDDSWSGRLRGRFEALEARWQGIPSHPILRKSDYRIYDHRREVPEAYWRHPDLIVEKFLPERTEGGGYAVRNCYVLGDKMLCERTESTSPIVSDATMTSTTDIEPHPAIAELCTTLHVDYAKIDYTIHEGAPVVLDVNKTVGASARPSPELDARRRAWAEGLWAFLDARRRPA